VVTMSFLSSELPLITYHLHTIYGSNVSTSLHILHTHHTKNTHHIHHYWLLCHSLTWLNVYSLNQGEKAFCAHCPGCGRIQFGPAESLARLEAGAPYVCNHGVELTHCKRGFTSWCPLCRVRTPTYHNPS